MPDIIETEAVSTAESSELEFSTRELRSRPVSVEPAPVDKPGYYKQIAMVTWPYVLTDALSTIIGCMVIMGLDKFLGGTGRSLGSTIGWGEFSLCAVLSNLLWFWHTGLYPGLGLNPSDELQKVARSIFCSVSMVTIGFMLLVGGSVGSMLLMLGLMPILWLSVPTMRGWCKSVLLRCKVFIPCYFLGNRSEVLAVYKQMTLFGRSLLRPVGRLVYDHRENSASPTTERILMSEADELRFEREAQYKGTFDDLQQVASAEGVYWLIEANRVPTTRRMHQQLISLFPQVIHVNPMMLEIHQGTVFCSGAAAGVCVQSAALRRVNRLIKRLMDIGISASALVILSPLFLLIAIGIRLSGPGPIMFYHERLGKGGRTFRAWKFRSMVDQAASVLKDHLEKHPEARQEWEQNHKLKKDPRITWIGRILRKTSLDELPQLLNVLVGEMSLVGPRPIVKEEIGKYGETYEDYKRVMPGLTGLWQISGRNNTSYADRLNLDRYYVANWSPWLDLHILLRTVKTVLFCEGAY